MSACKKTTHLLKISVFLKWKILYKNKKMSGAQMFCKLTQPNRERLAG